jgi:hypothetical protein
MDNAVTPESRTKSSALKFVVLDEEDLEVVSTHLQDAWVKVADVIWQPQARRLVIGLDRFDWEGAIENPAKTCRRRTALRFERVQSFKRRGVDPNGKAEVLSLLAVEFEPTDEPSGVVTLVFSGEAAFRLEVECLEAEFADLGPMWDCTAGKPHHALESEG